MVVRWFLGFALALQVFASVSAAINKNDPNLSNVISNWNKQFEGTKKNISLADKLASGKMDTMINQIDGSSQVSNRIKDSIADSETGRKVNVTANVTQTANKAKVASTLVERLNKAKDFAKHAGKASIPAFVGGAAFQALMDGVGWVMDEGGKVTKKPVYDNYIYDHAVVSGWKGSTASAACSLYASKLNDGQVVNVGPIFQSDGGYIFKCEVTYLKGEISHTQTGSIVNYRENTDTPPAPEEVSQEELIEALKKALDSNNPALAAAIADAIKSAYTPDNSPGQSLVDIPSNGTAMDATDSAVDAVRKAGKSTGEQPTSGGKPGYYKITDGDKTIEGYVYPTDGTATGNTDSTTVTNPDGSTTTTGSTSLSWPNFCDWAGVVCEFIDWVKEDEPLEEEKPEEIDDSIFSRKFDIDFEMSASCPPNPIWNFEFVGTQWSKEINITMVCDFFKYLGYALLFASNMTALWIVYSAVVVRDQA